VLPSNESEADRTPIGSPPHRSSLTNKPTSDTSTFNCNTAASIAFFGLLRYILCNSTSILLSEPHPQLCATRRCFPESSPPRRELSASRYQYEHARTASPTNTVSVLVPGGIQLGRRGMLRWLQSLKISNADEDTVQTRPWIC